MRMLRDLALNMATNATISPSSLANNVMTKTAKNYNAWKSPIPYLFGSLAVMLLLIAVALVLLVFSYRKSRRGDRRDGDQKKLPKAAIEAVDVEPRVVVIMAGDDKPTYLATPSLTLAMPSANICSCHHHIINTSHDQDNDNNNNN